MILGIIKKDHLAELQRPKLCPIFGGQFTGDGLFYVCKSFGTVNCFQLSSSGISKVFIVF